LPPRKTAARKSRKPAARGAGARKTSRPAAKAPRRKKAPPRPAPPKRPAPPAADAASLEVARLAANAALDKKAEDVVILDVRGLSSYADYFVVATGTSDRQVSAIADSVEGLLRKAGHRPIGVEGYSLGHWVLLDFGDVVAHVFYEEARQFYDIEGLWADARRVPVP
jgi:ribosome-associated protein